MGVINTIKFMSGTRNPNCVIVATVICRLAASQGETEKNHEAHFNERPREAINISQVQQGWRSSLFLR